MEKFFIFVIFSAIMLTFVAIAMIPQIIIPEDIDNSFIKPPNAKIKIPAQGNSNKGLPQTGCGLGTYSPACKIVDYLEQNFVDPIKDGKVFCAYDKVGQSETGDMIYLNYLCEEFYLSKGRIYQASGASGPAKIVNLDNGSLGHWVPRDGSYFYRDINEFFPEEYRSAAQGFDIAEYEKLAQINRERAKASFSADFDYKIEKTTDTACVHDLECPTPGEYLMMSRRPFTSACISGKCTVICPRFTNTQLEK